MHVYLVCLIVVASCWLVWRAIYLAFFHPLAKYPGPFLAKFTYAYAGYHGYKGDVQIDHWRCHEKYGPIVRYGPNQVIFNTKEGLKDIFGPSVSAKFTKSKHFGVLALNKHSTLTLPGGPDHLRRRRILSQGVGDQAQREYQPRILAHIDHFLNIVAGPPPAPPSDTDNNKQGEPSWSRPVNMAHFANYLSFDFMMDFVYGAKYNLLGNERFRYIVDAMERTNVRNSALIQFPAMRCGALRLEKHLFPTAQEGSRRFLRFLGRLLHDRAQLHKGNKCGVYEGQPIVPRDVYSNLEVAKDPVSGEGFDYHELASESVVLIFAGSDTTACAFASTLFYLADNERCYLRARDEIRSTFKNRSEITLGSALSSCTYLRACIDEALRMSPPVGTGNGRETPPGGITIAGEFIPGNMDVGVSTYAIHRNEEYYAQPSTFRPERWIEGEQGVGRGTDIATARACFSAFSQGIRSCIGKGLAYTELMLTLACVMYECDFRFADGELGWAGHGSEDAEYGRHHVGEFQLKDCIVGQKEGPWLVYKRRNLVEQ